MIKVSFLNFKLKILEENAQQYDNGVIKIAFQGDFSDIYTYKMYLSYKGYLDIIDLDKDNLGNYYTYLTSEQLAFSGIYNIQVFGISKDGSNKKKHSNIVNFKCFESLSGDAHWITIPTEFEQFKSRLFAEIEIILQNIRNTLSNYYNKEETDATFATQQQLNIVDNTILGHMSQNNNPHKVTKTQVGLGNADNTSDLNKPISNATRTALDGKVNQATGYWLSTNIGSLSGEEKIYLCTESYGNFIEGYFYATRQNPQTAEMYWERIYVQPQTDLSNYYNKPETDDLLDTKQPLTNIENGEGNYSLQQKTDAENQPLTLGKWSTAEGRGQNFIGDIIDLPTAQYLFALRVIGTEEVTDNIFYYRPTTDGLAPNKIYSMSLVWENTGRAFSYGTNGTFCIYAYNGSSWVPITSTNYTTSFKINSIPLQNEATYYNITFKTESVPELREIVFAFGALSSKSVGFNTGKWILYRLDDDVWTNISDRCPNFATVQFRGASDNAMNNWFNYAGTDRGMIWRRNIRDDLSYKDEYGAEKWYKSNNIVIGGINADKIRENAVLWFPINGGSLSNTQGAYFYVKNASKSCLALLELDDDERQIKDDNGTIIRHQSIFDSGIGSHVLVYMGAAISSDSHTEGNFNNAVWLNSDTRINEVDVRRQHVEGSRNLATGYAATISGEYNRATGNHTDVGGEHNEARYAYQTVRGYHNDNKEGNLFEIGNGNEDIKRNAFEVHSDGTAKVQVQGDSPNSVAQKQYVDNKLRIYNHAIYINFTGDNLGSVNAYFNIISSNETIFSTIEMLKDWIDANASRPSILITARFYPASGACNGGYINGLIVNGTNLRITGYTSGLVYDDIIPSDATIIDTVTSLGE